MQTKILDSLDRLHEKLQASGGVNSNDKYYAGGSSKVTEDQLTVIS